jgi:hypothetical protein
MPRTYRSIHHVAEFVVGVLIFVTEIYYHRPYIALVFPLPSIELFVFVRIVVLCRMRGYLGQPRQACGTLGLNNEPSPNNALWMGNNLQINISCFVRAVFVGNGAVIVINPHSLVAVCNPPLPRPPSTNLSSKVLASLDQGSDLSD